MESKLEYYIGMPDFTSVEAKNNKKVSLLISENRNKEAYDILFKMLKSNNEENFNDKKTRYILIRIAHLYINSEMWEDALNIFVKIMKYTNSVGNPLLHLRIGQIGFELKEQNIYEDNLARALIMGELKIFEGENDILKNIALKILKPPAGGWEKYDGQDWLSTK